ncbi:hypothetical protein ACHAQA_003720 [Verticillium albo-atrum]
MRLVKIEPAKEGRPMVCTLRHVTFAERPQYETLSYLRGTQAGKRRIVLDGAEFLVGRNLYDALYFLRDHYKTKKTMLFWIDVLSVNQDDVAERTNQLRMMWQIYFRAKRAVVWLGNKYMKHNLAVTQAQTQAASLDTATNASESSTEDDGQPRGPARLKLAEERLVQALTQDDYWRHAWTTQAIGQASHRRICFGTRWMTWTAFIRMVKQHGGSSHYGPLRLSELLRFDKEHSRTLMHLLVHHRDAFCEEPRDRIYAFVGLASDAYDFSMDYNRSIYQVWADTMQFLNKINVFSSWTLEDPDVPDRHGEVYLVSFGYMIKSFLVKTHDPCKLPEEPPQSYEVSEPVVVSVYEENEIASVFTLDCQVVGRIAIKGPSCNSIVANIDTTARWCRDIQKMQETHLDKKESCKQNENLLRAIVKMSDDDLNKACYGSSSSVHWTDGQHFCREEAQEMEEEPTQYVSTGSPGLYHLELSPMFSTWRMGIASSQARVGDSICWVQGTKKALVVRSQELLSDDDGEHEQSFKMQACGTALVSEDVSVAKEAINHSKRWRELNRDNEYLNTVKIDTRTLYHILPGKEEYEAARRMS